MMSHLMGRLETLVPISITVKAKRKSKGEEWGQLGSPLNFFCSFPDTIRVWRPGSRTVQPWLKSTHTLRETGRGRCHIKSRWLRRVITGDGTSQSRVWSKIKSTTHKASSNYSLLPKLRWGDVQCVRVCTYERSEFVGLQLPWPQWGKYPCLSLSLQLAGHSPTGKGHSSINTKLGR